MSEWVAASLMMTEKPFQGVQARLPSFGIHVVMGFSENFTEERYRVVL